MGIDQKKINETIYWLELLKKTDYLGIEQFESINTDAKLEQAFIELLDNEGYPHFVGSSLVRSDESEVLVKEDLKTYLQTRYQNANLTEVEA